MEIAESHPVYPLDKDIEEIIKNLAIW